MLFSLIFGIVQILSKIYPYINLALFIDMALSAELNLNL